MNNLQMKLLEIMKWFHNLCQENSLKYYIAYGTLLGAIRHKGFIPWDDDIDVCMPRNDYEKLKLIFHSHKNVIDHYFLENPYLESMDYLYPFCKLYDINTTMIESASVECIRGVFIDIFPIDGAGDTWNESERNYEKIDFYKKLRKARVWPIGKSDKLFVKFAIMIVKFIPRTIYNLKWINRKIDKLSRSQSYSDSVYVGDLIGPYKTKGIMKREIFGSPKLYKFEHEFLYGPEFGEIYLKNIYGKWKELPPIAERKHVHNLTYLNFKESFLDNCEFVKNNLYLIGDKR